MSTRATYQIDSYTFYIHHDGYPEGAAMYLYEALKHEDKRSRDYSPNASFADYFIRANNRAELTKSHESHGDTEYHYTVKTSGGKKTVSMYKRVRIDGRSAWVTDIHSMPIDEFIAKYDSLIEI